MEGVKVERWNVERKENTKKGEERIVRGKNKEREARDGENVKEKISGVKKRKR